MNTKEYVHSLFREYEESGSLNDFMEELQSNMDARIASLVKKGMSEEEAFNKAKEELGDISAMADELSLNKKREVFEEAYMDVQKYMTGGRIAAYVVFGVVLVFGLIVSLMARLAVDRILHWGFSIVASIGAFMPFFVTAACGFTFLGVTQETRSHFPVSKKRAGWYTVAAGLISFGLTVMPLTYFSIVPVGDFVGNFLFFDPFFGFGGFIPVTAMLAILMVFVLPGIGLLLGMILSEKSRLKPWAKAQRDEYIKKGQQVWNDPSGAMRFGLFSGAIWLLAVVLFVVLGFLFSFRISWLIFILAMAVQLIIQGVMTKKK